MKVPRTEVGMEMRTFKVEDQEPRKSQHTKPVKTAASTMWWVSSRTESSM